MTDNTTTEKMTDAAGKNAIKELLDAAQSALDGGCFKHPSIPRNLRQAIAAVEAQQREATLDELTELSQRLGMYDLESRN